MRRALAHKPALSQVAYSLFGTQTPQVPVYNYANPATLGTRFYSSVAGNITGVRFYKGSSAGGNSHTVALYTDTGTLLASKVTSGETVSGWQTQLFDSPVAITANTTYCVAVYWPNGYFPYSADFFINQYDATPLHALASSNGGNGRYYLGPGLTFPPQSYNEENYYSDVILTQEQQEITGGLGINAVYLTIGSGYPPDPVSVMSSTGIKEFALAFINSDQYGNPKWAWWDGLRDLTSSEELNAISNIRAAGGDVIVSFGGANGYKFGETCATAAAFASAIQQVINAFSLKAIDYDIEGTEIYGTAAVRQRVIDGLKIVQTNNPNVRIYVTLPGSDSDCVDLIQKGAAVGLNVQSWVGMPFNFSSHSGSMGTMTVTATDQLKTAVASAYGYDSATAYRHVGISSMSGHTDAYVNNGETVYLSDFNIMLAYARANHIGRFTFWNLNRDRQCDGGPAPCSGIPQGLWDFTKVIASYLG